MPGAVPGDEHGVPRGERDQAPPVRNRGAQGNETINNLVSMDFAAASRLRLLLVNGNSWRPRITVDGLKIRLLSVTSMMRGLFAPNRRC